MNPECCYRTKRSRFVGVLLGPRPNALSVSTATLHCVLVMQLILHYFQFFFTNAALPLCQTEFHKIQNSDKMLNLLPMLHTQTIKFQSFYLLYFPQIYMGSNPPLPGRASKPGDPPITNSIVYFVIIAVPHTTSICLCPFGYQSSLSSRG